MLRGLSARGIWRSRSPSKKRAISNILVVTEYFSAGGLETQVCGQADYLRQCGIELHLATSSPRSELGANTFATSLFDLPMQTTAETFLQTVAKLEERVDALDIDLIHAHPFFSFAAAMVVAHRKGLPLVATLHGPTSVAAGIDTIFDILFQKALLPHASMLICVSPEVSLLARTAGRCVPLVLPNAVQVPEKAPISVNPTLPWVWAGRLDDDKFGGLRALIAELDRLKCNPLHIYGDGSKVSALQQLLQEIDPLSEWFSYRGWDHDLVDRLGQYSLVAGMGRVILEGAAQSRPCLLVGYDGIKGILSREMMEKAGYWNFSGRGLRSIDQGTFKKQVKELQQTTEPDDLRAWVREKHSEEVIWHNYYDKIGGLPVYSSPVIDAFYECLEYSGESFTQLWGDNKIYLMMASISNIIGGVNS